MGRSTPQHRQHHPAGVAGESNAAPQPIAAVLRRRDSGGSSGTTLLTNENVNVKGPRSQTRNNKKEERWTNSVVPCACGRDGGKHSEVVDVAAPVEGDERDRCQEHDDVSLASSKQDENAVGDDHRQDGHVSGCPADHTMGFGRLNPSHRRLPTTPSFSKRSSLLRGALDAETLLRCMRHIVNLNQSAMNYHLSGGDVAWALDALHKAESIRCHLVDELRAMQNVDGNNAKQAAHQNDAVDRRMKFRNLKNNPSVFSASLSEISTSEANPSLQPHKKIRRNSFHNDRQPEHQASPDSMPSPSDGEDVARTSYIYQRMDFDEGMHSFANLEPLRPASFWLPIDEHSTILLPRETSPEVEATLAFNVGQVHRRSGNLDAASRCYDRAFDVLCASSDAILSPTLPKNALERALHCEDHPIVIPLLHNIGQLQYRRGDVTLAMETYTLALRHARMMHGGRHPHVASALNCLGVLHYHNANSCDETEEEAAAKETVAQNASVRGASGNCGGNCSNQNNQKQHGEQRRSSTNTAMSLFHQALAIRVKILGPNHVDVATALNNIGRIHVQLDEFDQALGYYEDALLIRRAALGVDSLDYAATAFNAGQSFHQKGELTRAAELYHEFLRVALMKFGHGHRDVAVVLSGIAQIHQEKNENDKALELYEASLAAGRAALGEDHSEIAMLLNRMGNFHFEQERLDDALRCYKRGLRIERRVLTPDHPNIVVTMSNLGEIHRQRSEWDEAAKMYGDCLDILRKKHDNKDHGEVASTLSTIGLIHNQRGETCLSLHYLQDALLMRRRLMGKNHLDVSATLVYIGTILYRKSVFSTAMDLFSESLRIRKAALGKDHRDVAFVLYNIGLIHQQRGCYEEAVECYSETLRIEKLVLGAIHRDVSMTLFKLGEVNKAAGDLEEALKCFKDSLAVERALPSSSANSDTVSSTASDARRQQQSTAAEGPDNAAMARALNEIGNIHLSLGDVVPMMQALNEASRLYRAAGLNPNNVVVSRALYALDCSCPEAAPAA